VGPDQVQGDERSRLRHIAGVGRILPFRRRRWTKARHFGHVDPRTHVSLRGVARETVQWLGKLRPFILGAIALSIWPAMDPALVDPPEFLAGEPERVHHRFTRCGPGRGHACVIDGDTFKIGTRKVRIIGIDTPEVDARCPKEAALAEQATAALQENLNRGPFEMLAPPLRSRDQYGRELRTLRRKRPDGSYNLIARQMRETGLARRYLGGFRTGWC
jgi:endonuclease YncB( thermonuclease family)